MGPFSSPASRGLFRPAECSHSGLGLLSLTGSDASLTTFAFSKFGRPWGEAETSPARDVCGFHLSCLPQGILFKHSLPELNPHPWGLWCHGWPPLGGQCWNAQGLSQPTPGLPVCTDPVSWLQPVPALAAGGIWGMNPWMKDLSAF